MTYSLSFLKLKHPNLLLFFLFAALLPYLLLSFYIHPIADDFIYALKGEDFTKNLWRDYMTWNGRYASNIIVFCNVVLVKHRVLYNAYPIVLIFLLIVSSYWFITTAIEKGISYKDKLTLSLIFVLLFPNLMPKESEGLYWFTGSATYIFPCALFLIYLSLIITFFRNKVFLNKTFHLSLAIFLLFFLCGFNEVMSILLSLFHFWGFILIKNIDKRVLIILLIVALGGMTLMAGAPGNAIRSLNFPEQHRLFHSILYSILQTIRFSSIWILSPAFLLATLLYLPIARLPFASMINPFLILIALFSIIFFAAFAPYWSTGILGQHRTINNACFLFILFWFFALQYLIKFVPLSFLEIIQDRFFQSSATVLLIIALFLTKNSLTSWADLISGKASQYNNELVDREHALTQCKQHRVMDCAVPTLTVFPKSIFVLDIQNPSSDWINIDYARYYGLNSVSIKQ